MKAYSDRAESGELAPVHRPRGGANRHEKEKEKESEYRSRILPPTWSLFNRRGRGCPSGMLDERTVLGVGGLSDHPGVDTISGATTTEHHPTVGARHRRDEFGVRAPPNERLLDVFRTVIDSEQHESGRFRIAGPNRATIPNSGASARIRSMCWTSISRSTSGGAERGLR